jgi:hypothetical protein
MFQVVIAPNHPFTLRNNQPLDVWRFADGLANGSTFFAAAASRM